MADKKFDLGDYVEVKDRIAILYELYPQARLVTDEVTILTAPDDRQRVMVKALAFRTPDDPHPAVGYSWMELPGTTSYTKGSELENTETSAWGRAIAALGILIDKSIASGQEVKNKQNGAAVEDENEATQTSTVAEHVEFLGKIQKVGTIQKGGAAQYQGEFSQTPEGHSFGFRLKLAGDERDIPQVLVTGDYGEALWLAYAGETAGIIGSHVTVKGRLYNVRPTGRRSYYRLVIGEAENDLIETPVVRVPAVVSPLRDPEPVEAPSLPLPMEALDPEERLLVGGGLPE